MSWKTGSSTVQYLLESSRLERLSTRDADKSADAMLERARRRLATAVAGAGAGDVDGAFVLAYDAYRIAVESLLVRQALRATGGPGSHVTVEDSVSAQFGGLIQAFSKLTFERFRRQRHSAQYFDPESPEITSDDADWAIATAGAAITGTLDLSLCRDLTVFDGRSG